MPLIAYVDHLTRIFLSRNVVKTSAQGKLRMRKQNANRAVPLDAVPERRTNDVPRDFGPVIAFVS